LKPLAGLGVALVIGAAAVSAAAASDGVEALSGFGLNVTDIEASARFYEMALGFKEARRIPQVVAPARVIALSLTGGTDAPLIVLKRSDTPLPPDHTSFGRIITASHDARAVAARVRAAGYPVVRIVEEPNGPGSMEVWTRDPDGYDVEVFQAPTPASPTRP
jgi:catechol 2,3-dioxygenase-like lactoylglutathione lyase family enzyme